MPEAAVLDRLEVVVAGRRLEEQRRSAELVMLTNLPAEHSIEHTVAVAAPAIL